MENLNNASNKMLFFHKKNLEQNRLKTIYFAKEKFSKAI